MEEKEKVGDDGWEDGAFFSVCVCVCVLEVDKCCYQMDNCKQI